MLALLTQRTYGLGLAALLACGVLVLTSVSVSAAPLPDDTKKDAKKDDAKSFDEKLRKLIEDFQGGDRDKMLEAIKKLVQESLPDLGGGFNPDDLRKQMEEFRRQFGQGGARFRFGARAGAAIEERLGATFEKPSATLVDQLDLPKSKGLVVESVKADGPAAKAGIKANDILLKLSGKDVPSDPADFAKLIEDIKADAKVDAEVLRKGKKETIKDLVLPEVKREPRNPFNRVRGAPPDGFQVVATIGQDEFSIRRTEGDEVIVASGKIVNGKPDVSKIVIKDQGGTQTYESLDKVPEKYRDKVKQMIGQAFVKP